MYRLRHKHTAYCIWPYAASPLAANKGGRSHCDVTHQSANSPFESLEVAFYGQRHLQFSLWCLGGTRAEQWLMCECSVSPTTLGCWTEATPPTLQPFSHKMTRAKWALGFFHVGLHFSLKIPSVLYIKSMCQQELKRFTDCALSEIKLHYCANIHHICDTCTFNTKQKGKNMIIVDIEMF